MFGEQTLYSVMGATKAKKAVNEPVQFFFNQRLTILMYRCNRNMAEMMVSKHRKLIAFEHRVQTTDCTTGVLPRPCCSQEEKWEESVSGLFPPISDHLKHAIVDLSRLS